MESQEWCVWECCAAHCIFLRSRLAPTPYTASIKEQGVYRSQLDHLS